MLLDCVNFEHCLQAGVLDHNLLDNLLRIDIGELKKFVLDNGDKYGSEA
jgi:hypothetical protein